MISAVSLVLSILFWVVVAFVGWFVFAETVGRLIRRFIHFPLPAFMVRFIDNPIRRRIQSPTQVVDWMAIQNGMHVLEIGPGSGTFAIEVSKRVGEEGHVFVVDIQPAVVSRLDKRLKKNKITTVTAKVASAHEFPFADSSFERVFMMSVLGEISDKEKALLEIRRVLKDDGLLAVGELLWDPDYPRRKTVIGWCRDGGFQLTSEYGGLQHYLLTFSKTTTGD
jgi:ubiquinone/menaquinone biosynthesis C-methylase UbiE